MTWINGPVEVRNNIIAGTTGNCLLCVEDYSKQLTAEQMQVTALGNVYQRPTTSSPTWVAVWSTGAGNPKVFTTLAASSRAPARSRPAWPWTAPPPSTPTAPRPTDVQNAVGRSPRRCRRTWRPSSGVPAGSKRLGSTLTY